MIESIHLENFKSIINDTVPLRDFTVLIGANGSGKSNLIKALEFLSTIPESGIATAITRFGGFSGIVPKAIPNNIVNTSRIHFKYCIKLPVLIKVSPPISVNVEHEFELGFSEKEIARLCYEQIKFNEALAFAEILMNATKAISEKQELNKEKELHISYTGSSFTIRRGSRGGISFIPSPTFSNETLPYWLTWLGLEFLGDKVTSKNSINKILLNSVDRNQEKKFPHKDRGQLHSFLDSGFATMIDGSPQGYLFQSHVSSIRRYDLLLNELRTEQPPSNSRTLSPAGENMPSVLRHLNSNPDYDSIITRIKGTLAKVAPHVDTIKHNSLKTGREYVEFIETELGRRVESWESSDGTLRALAILLALETHPNHRTLIIEEPEQNLHPWAVTSIIDHIREVVKARHLQVIVTTHSQQVLERVHPDEVLVAMRTPTEGTKFKRLAELLPNKEVEMGEVGALWVRGLLGGVPSYE